MSLAQSLLDSPIFQQIAPLLVVVLSPLLAFFVAARLDSVSLRYTLQMVLESLGFALPWNWSSGQRQRSTSMSEKRTSRKARSRHEKAGTDQKSSVRNDDTSDEHYGYYPGLVNVSGTYCFMNSTVQALASLYYLQPWINNVREKAEIFDVPTPTIDALQDLLHELNSPRTSYTAIRPMRLIEALSNPSPEVKRNNSLLYSREHQDAQELFQLLSECIKAEAAEVDKESRRDRGLVGLSIDKSNASRDISKGVFDGLTANRRSCMECGYTEAVMHFAFDNWQLSVPRSVSVCKIEDCLQEYTRLELLTDCICRRCSMVATHKHLVKEVEKYDEAVKADSNVSQSKKRRAKDVKKMESRVKAALEEGRIEDDIKDLKMEKVFSKASTKQAMIARPPPVLALHLNRSLHYGSYAAKNTLHVRFPELLDLTPFTTSGKLSMIPSVPISSPSPVPPRSTTPTPSTYSSCRTIYRLSSVVCHYGQHSFGHYICYRRKPRPPSSGRWTPPRLLSDPVIAMQRAAGIAAFAYVADKPADEPVVWEGDEDQLSARGTGRGWLRISDDAVKEVGIETVLGESSAAFMLYYERVAIGQSPYSSAVSGTMQAATASEETLKPEVVLTNGHANGSTTSLLSPGIGLGVRGERAGGRMVGPRVIRNVATRRARSLGSQSIERTTCSSTMSQSAMVDKPDTKKLLEESVHIPNGSAKHISDPPPLTHLASASAPESISERPPSQKHKSYSKDTDSVMSSSPQTPAILPAQLVGLRA